MNYAFQTAKKSNHMIDTICFYQLLNQDLGLQSISEAQLSNSKKLHSRNHKVYIPLVFQLTNKNASYRISIIAQKLHTQVYKSDSRSSFKCALGAKLTGKDAIMCLYYYFNFKHDIDLRKESFTSRE
jgi:hypothetical protein